ncbi:MAG TPA: RNA polymerase sigma-70 factor [Puia sp.]|nr:RNA polymerase sigma-70 factor [Puia sp.]
MNQDEEKTWRSIQQKDGQAFENYYKTHYKAFFLAAFTYLKDAGIAEEIVNDVFVKVWEDSDTIQIESSLRAYIYRAVINRSLNQLDKSRKTREQQKEYSRRPEGSFDSRAIEENELKIRLYQAIDQLPEQCQKVFRMSRFEQLKQQEIANRLNISIKTVKNHITHALKQLSKVLIDWNAMPLWIVVLKDFFWPGH